MCMFVELHYLLHTMQKQYELFLMRSLNLNLIHIFLLKLHFNELCIHKNKIWTKYSTALIAYMNYYTLT